MKIKIKGKELNITYRTNSEMYTTEVFSNKQFQMGVDVYNIDGRDDICLIATTDKDPEYFATGTVITAEEYQNILDLWNPYDSYPYHSALVETVRQNLHTAQVA